MAGVVREAFFGAGVMMTFGMVVFVACGREDDVVEDGERPCAFEGKDPVCPEGWYCRTGSDAPNKLRCYKSSGSALDEDSGVSDLSPNTMRLEKVGEYSHENSEGNISSIGMFNVTDWGHEMAVWEDTIYLADIDNGLLIIDLSNPSKPELLGQFLRDQIYSIAVEGQYAYLVQRNWNLNIEMPLLDTERILIVNISDTSSPELVGQYNTLCTPWYACMVTSIRAREGYAYLGEFTALEGLDMTDPGSPHLAWSMTTTTGSSETPVEMEVEGDFLYVAAGLNGFQILDINTPERPALLAEMAMPDAVLDVAVVDGVAYLTLGDTGLMAIDVHNPAQPQVLGHKNLDTYAYRLAVSGEVVFVTYYTHKDLSVYEQAVPAVEDSGIMAIDVRDEERMAVIETAGGMVGAQEIAVYENLVLVNEAGTGIIIFEVVHEGS